MNSESPHPARDHGNRASRPGRPSRPTVRSDPSVAELSPETAVERFQDISELLQTGEPVVLAVDQVPFEVDSRGVRNTFCLLVPLMTEHGSELEREQLRNRGRVWWMLRSDIDPVLIQVGSVWSGPIERSRAYGNPEREKDHYQVRRSDIRPGARHLVEVLNLKVTHPDLTELLSPRGIPWPYRPLPRIVVRGGLSVVGPFRSAYDHQDKRLTLQSLTAGEPLVFRVSRGEFESNTKLREYGYRANRWDSKGQESRIELTFLDERELGYLEREGEQLDGATDRQVVRWALELMEIPKSERQQFGGIFEKAGTLDDRLHPGLFPGRFDRFIKLCEKRERIIELGSQVAELLSTREGFSDLVRLHIENLTSERVDAAVEARRGEIEATTSEAEARLAKLQEMIEELEVRHARRKEELDREITELHAERIQSLEEREAAVERDEREMRERLESLVALYRQEADRFGDRLLAQLPIMQRLGILGPPGAGGGAPARPGAPGPGLELPAFLAEERARSDLTEEGFVEQFERVVARHGFVFDTEDLVNFHVLVKTGMWTILTGPSGLGKSSLPRLYAEALGCLEEFLLIPVRPDWLDDRDVIGAFNALSRRYEPATCGLIDRLISAHVDQKNGRGGIYVICLDEMNLARVEHYFAQFLSVMEQPANERFLNLFARGLVMPEDPYAPYRKLPLGTNIRLVGTVNVDETTHFFSPKVIDRVSISTFGRPDLRLGLGRESRPSSAGGIESIHHDNYNAWVRPPDESGEAVDLVLKVDDALGRSRLGLGFRLRDRILSYISSARPLLGEDRAIDFALLQNVLPSLRPLAPGYIELLRDLRNLLPPGRFSRSAGMLEALEEDPESDFFQLL